MIFLFYWKVYQSGYLFVMMFSSFFEIQIFMKNRERKER